MNFYKNKIFYLILFVLFVIYWFIPLSIFNFLFYLYISLKYLKPIYPRYPFYRHHFFLNKLNKEENENKDSFCDFLDNDLIEYCLSLIFGEIFVNYLIPGIKYATPIITTHVINHYRQQNTPVWIDLVLFLYDWYRGTPPNQNPPNFPPPTAMPPFE